MNKRKKIIFHKDPSIIEIYTQTSHKRIQLVISLSLSQAYSKFVNWKESLMSDVACLLHDQKYLK